MVMMDPALSSGYLQSLLMILRFWGSTLAKIRFIKLAGKSSNKSTVSSIYKESMTSFNSDWVNKSTRCACIDELMQENTLDASSLGIKRNAKAQSFGSRLSNNLALSIALFWVRTLCAFLYSLDERS